ncbi:MAG: tetratricopeptide repeat protein, partial [Vicinamibacteraceae bacterium]
LALALSALLAQAPAAPKPASRSFADLSAAAAEARDAGRMDAAIGLYRQAIALRGDWNEGRWYLGSALYERERYGECREAFAALIARQPGHAGGVGMKGLCEFELGQHETALRTLLRARSLGIAKTPEIAHVVAYHAGILLTRFGEFEVGYAVLTELAGDNIESPKTNDALGLNLLRMPILPAALSEAKRPMVQLAGRAAFAMGGRRLADAGHLLDELVATYPREPNVHYARGVLRTTEAPDLALEDFVAELAVSPRHVPARLQLVFELVKRGEAAKAKTYAEEAVRLDPQHFAVHLAMGQVWFETGDLPKAIAAFEHGATLAPGSPQAHFLLARAYARAGRSVDAERERGEFRRLEQLKVGQPVEASGGRADPP